MYDRPELYDILATPGTAAEADVLERLHRRHGTGRARPVAFEPACGTARLLRVLGGRGWRAEGRDRDPGMVAYARRRLARLGLARRVRVAAGEMAAPRLDVPDASVDLAFLPDNSLRHLETDRAVRDHLAGVARVLRPGGIHVVGLSVAAPGGDPPEEDVWSAARGRCRVTQVVNWLPAGPRRERALSHLMVERPRGVEHLDASYDLRTYTEAQWVRLLRGAPLVRTAVLDRFGRPRDGRPLAYQLEILRRE